MGATPRKPSGNCKAKMRARTSAKTADFSAFLGRTMSLYVPLSKETLPGTHDTVQNLGVNKLSLLLASRRPGRHDHSIPSADYRFRSCSPPGSGRSRHLLDAI